MNLKRHASSLRWIYLLILVLSTLIAFSTASRGRRDGRIRRGYLRINNRPEVVVFDNDKDIERLEYSALKDINQAEIVDGPPGMGCVFAAAPNDQSTFVSQTFYSPSTARRFSRATTDLGGQPFRSALSLICSILPDGADPERTITALIQSPDPLPESSPLTPLSRPPVRSSDDHAFFLYSFQFDLPTSEPDGIESLAFPEPFPTDKAAIVHAGNLDSKCAVTSRKELSFFTLQEPCLERFEGTRVLLCAESSALMNALAVMD